MRIALVTTTINVPKVLELYRSFGHAIGTFVIGDIKTPHADAAFLCKAIGAEYYAPDRQDKLGYACSDLIGWNCIQRKNIGYLEALKWGADIILTTDDDNLPIDPHFFFHLLQPFQHGFSGIEVSSPTGWFDSGQLLTPTVRHRGLPIDLVNSVPALNPVTNVNVGVVAGLWVGDADVDAAHRIAIPPQVHSATALAQAGVVVHPGTTTVFNAQNVAFRRELAPAMFLAPGLGRSDDIFASLIAQRVMREHGMQVRIGKPFTACWQDRSTESLLADLADEHFGMGHVAHFADALSKIELTKNYGTPLEQVRFIYSEMNLFWWWPARATECALSWLDDCEKVL